jgi:hypothetical protein
MDWVSGLSEPQKHAVVNQVMNALAGEDASEVSAWFERVASSHGMEGDEAVAAGNRMVQARAAVDAGDVQTALRLCKPADAAYSMRCSNDLVMALDGQDSHAAGDWLKTLPPGAAKDNGFSLLAGAHLDSPSDAAAYVEEIGDPDQREESAAGAFEKWNVIDPAAAHTWIESLQGVDERWRARFLRMHP